MRWVSWTEKGLEKKVSLSQNQWLDIRYEELVTNPKVTYSQIFSFLNLERGKESLAKAFPGSVGKWKKGLSSLELEDVLSVASKQLVKLGYSLG